MSAKQKLSDVQVLWPRIDKPYVFDPQMNQTRAALPGEKGHYEFACVVDEERAEEICKQMQVAADTKFPRQNKRFKPADVWKRDTNLPDHYQVKFKHKDYDLESRPRVYMPDRSLAVDGFQLTTGSRCSVLYRLFAWEAHFGAGVSLMPKALQVLELAEASRDEGNPFDDDVGSGKAADERFDDSIPF